LREADVVGRRCENRLKAAVEPSRGALTSGIIIALKKAPRGEVADAGLRRALWGRFVRPRANDSLLNCYNSNEQ
jgi:hypothetical protein